MVQYLTKIISETITKLELKLARTTLNKSDNKNYFITKSVKSKIQPDVVHQ